MISLYKLWMLKVSKTHCKWSCAQWPNAQKHFKRLLAFISSPPSPPKLCFPCRSQAGLCFPCRHVPINSNGEICSQVQLAHRLSPNSCLVHGYGCSASLPGSALQLERFQGFFFSTLRRDLAIVETLTLNCHARLEAVCLHVISAWRHRPHWICASFFLPFQSFVHLSITAVISPASWREGQKLVKMVLGPGPQLPGQGRLATADGHGRTGGTFRLNVTSFLRACTPLSSSTAWVF